MRKLIIAGGEHCRRQLKDCAETGTTPVMRRDFSTEVKAVEGDARAVDFVISTAAVDRYGDTVAVEGWDLKNFRNNPVVLWMHDNTMLPVGKASNVRVEDGALKARVTFTPESLVKFNDVVLELVKTGYLNATSVGFIPTKYNFVDDPQRRFGIDFLEQELLEFSIVTVPANPEALIEGRSAPVAEPEPGPAVQPEPKGMSLDLAQRRLTAARLRAA